MMQCAWIRDGVLIDRMPENAVAFAFASFQHGAQATIEELISWGFEKSGIAAREKMQLFNEEREGTITLDSAAAYYTKIAEPAEVAYMPGAVALLKDLHKAGATSYITSAIEQSVLDLWRQTGQGSALDDTVEILGKKPNFSKGTGHFDYMLQRGNPIYFIADAEEEIRTGAGHEGILPIGFAHVITEERVVEAITKLAVLNDRLKERTPRPLSGYGINEALLHPPDERTLVDKLRQAGAVEVITGRKEEIMENVRTYLLTRATAHRGS